MSIWQSPRTHFNRLLCFSFPRNGKKGYLFRKSSSRVHPQGFAFYYPLHPRIGEAIAFLPSAEDSEFLYLTHRPDESGGLFYVFLCGFVLAFLLYQRSWDFLSLFCWGISPSFSAVSGKLGFFIAFLLGDFSQASLLCGFVLAFLLYQRSWGFYRFSAGGFLPGKFIMWICPSFPVV